MKRAFTLIELLVVITIIVILAGLIMPAVHLVKNRQAAPKVGEHYRWRGMEVEVIRSSTTLDTRSIRVRIDHGPDRSPRFEDLTVERTELQPLTEAR